MGRPTVLTRDLADQLVEAIARLPIKLAADFVGVGRRTVYDWLVRGDAGEEPYAALTARIAQARAAYADGRLKEIEQAARDGKRDWRASAWYLERCWPDLFGVKKTVEHTGARGDSPPIRVEVLSDGQLKQLDELLARLDAANRPRSDTPGGPGGTLPAVAD